MSRARVLRSVAKQIERDPLQQPMTFEACQHGLLFPLCSSSKLPITVDLASQDAPPAAIHRQCAGQLPIRVLECTPGRRVQLEENHAESRLWKPSPRQPG